MDEVEALSRIVGKRQVSTNEQELKVFTRRWGTDRGTMPLCIVRPRSTEEVQKIVRLANEWGRALVPCSSGEPHLKGGTVPETDGAVIVDLSQMDAIVRIDTRNKVAMVEPGVTFGMLQDAAARQRLRVVMPFMPRQRKSVVASLLEREPTTIPKYHWDMSDPLCCVEVVFGTGDLFRTGAAAGPGSLEQQWASGQAQKSPMGPSQTDWARLIQGSQGTMGIVTWATIKLELLPSVEKHFMVGVEELDRLIEFTYAIVRPRLPDLCFILDRSAVAAILARDSLKELPQWFLFHSISGYEHYPEDRLDYIEKDIADCARQLGVRPCERFGGISAHTVLGMASAASGESYWKTTVSGGFREIFFLTTLDRAPEFVNAMEKEATSAGLPRERLISYIQPLQQGRACHVEFTLTYDPADTDQEASIQGLLDKTCEILMDMGGFFSRPYDPWVERAYRKCPDTVLALRKVKRIVDPKGIMNPGKLCFVREE